MEKAGERLVFASQCEEHVQDGINYRMWLIGLIAAGDPERTPERCVERAIYISDQIISNLNDEKGN